MLWTSVHYALVMRWYAFICLDMPWYALIMPWYALICLGNPSRFKAPGISRANVQSYQLTTMTLRNMNQVKRMEVCLHCSMLTPSAIDQSRTDLGRVRHRRRTLLNRS